MAAPCLAHDCRNGRRTQDAIDRGWLREGRGGRISLLKVLVTAAEVAAAMYTLHKVWGAQGAAADCHAPHPRRCQRPGRVRSRCRCPHPSPTRASTHAPPPQADVVHGDLSAYNVLLTSTEPAAGQAGRGWCAKVSDFGLAQPLGGQSKLLTKTYGACGAVALRHRERCCVGLCMLRCLGACVFSAACSPALLPVCARHPHPAGQCLRT